MAIVKAKLNIMPNAIWARRLVAMIVHLHYVFGLIAP